MYNYKKHIDKKSLYEIQKTYENYYDAKGSNPYPNNKMDLGERGEFNIFKSLLNIKPSIRILIDLYIPTSNNKTTQIDLLFIHSTGIYVIESKNTYAKLSGNCMDTHLSMEYKNGKSFIMYNPILQNNAHISHIQSLLKHYPSDYFYSVLIIGNKKDNLSNLQIDTSKLKFQTMITTKSCISKKIEKLLYNRQRNLKVYNLLDEFEIDYIYNTLYNYTKASDDIKSNHIKNISKAWT